MSRVTVELIGHVLHIGLNRPDKYNAFDLQMLRELAAAYTRLEDEAEARCGLLYGHGDHFTSGLDLAEVGPAVAKGDPLFPAGQVDPVALGGRPRTKPVVQAAHGYCFTIGMELALANDLLVCAQDTKFGQIEVQRGIMPFGGATLRMPQRCGWGNAMRYLLTGARFDGDEAFRIGFAQAVAPDAQSALAQARALAEEVAAQAPLAVQATLVNARQCVEEGFDSAQAALMSQARALMSSADAAEGLLSFVERRAARFTGT